MLRKILLILFAASVIFAIVLLSIDNRENNSFSTENMKKFSDGVKRDSTMSDSDIKKALKSIFPNMKLD